MMRFVLNCSKGLIEWSSNGRFTRAGYDIRFIHETVRQHLLGGGLQRLDPLLGEDVVATSHVKLAGCCQAYLRLDMCSHLYASMNKTVEFVSVDTSNFGDTDARHLAYKMFPFLRYTQTSTFVHVRAAHTGGAYDLDNLQDFPLQEWVDITNVTHLRVQHLQPSTNVLHLLLNEKCFDMAIKMLMRYQTRLD